MSAVSASGRRTRYRSMSGRTARSVVRGAESAVSLIGEDHVDPVIDELRAAGEGRELEQEGETDDDPAEPLDQAGRGRRGTARRDHVVDDQHALSPLHGVSMDLEESGAVL